MDRRETNYPEENGFSCANCKFWRTNDFKFGNCLRFPPQQIGSNGDNYVFPKTTSKQWCGEWQFQELTLL